MLLKKTIQGVLNRHNAFPSKKLGQNFLVDELVIKRVVKAANLQPQDFVLEIGPGTGSLTLELAKRVKKVIAVEKDPRMIEVLKETLNDFQNIEIVSGDISKLEIWKLFENLKLKIKNFKVVANLPFYLTAPVIRQFLELTEDIPLLMTLIVQKEVAQRICAKPPNMNLLAVSVQFYAEPKIISFVSKKSFWPRPEVDGAILRIAPLIQVGKKPANIDLFFKIVRAGFSQPRKQILNNLARVLKLEKDKAKMLLLKSGLRPEQRAGNFSVRNWITLVNNFKKYAKE